MPQRNCRVVLIGRRALIRHSLSMQPTYIVIWIAKRNNSSGCGKKRLTQEEAEMLSAELNNKYPAFLHRALDTGIEQPETALRALRESLSSNIPSIGMPGPASMEAAQVEPDPWEEDVLPMLPKEVFALAF